jgi:type VI secretion system protein ImpJ
MKLLSRVVWSEGMYLGPHHFQVQNRYFEDSIRFAAGSLWFSSFGLAGVELDAEALQNGTISLVHARGIFPDGLPFNMPESDELPKPRVVTDLFPPTRSGVIVSLAIPQHKAGGSNLSTVEASDARYLMQTRVQHDENNGADDRPVRIGRKNLRLIIDSEPAPGCLLLPLARVKRDGSGHFVYDPNFVPPVLQVSASGRLMRLVQRMMELLEEKGGAVAARSAGPGGELTTREIANFWLLHGIHSALTPLRHQLIAKHGHPEELFLELSKLAGALCTFTLESHPGSLPSYDHRNLSDCFEKLDQHIRAHLETLVPTNVVSIPLRAAEGYFYEGEIKDQRCLGHSKWVFSIQASTTEAEIMSRVPQLIKVCSPPFVRELVRRALPGLAMTHLPVPPAAISTHREAQYFGLSRGGPCWDHMVSTRKIGVYVPGEFPTPEVEILVVLDNDNVSRTPQV